MSDKGKNTLMQRDFLIVTALIAAATLAIPLSAQGSPADVVDAFHTALAAGDSSSALELLDPQVLIYESGSVEATREEYRSHHLGADMAYAGATTRHLTKQSAGQSGDIAWVLSESTTTGTYRDREVNSGGTETMMLRRVGDGWLITHIHWSSRRVRAGS